MGLIDAALVIVSATVAVYCVARLGVTVWRRSAAPRGERLCDTTHAAMGAGMAVMASPHAAVIPGAAGIAVFGALGAGSAATLLADGAGARVGMDDGGDGGHGTYVFDLVVGCVAMIYMYVAGHGAEVAGAAGVAVDGPAGAHVHDAAPVPLLGWLLASYFVVAVASGGFRPGHHRGAEPVPRAPSFRHACEVAMAAAMAVMLVRSL